MLAVAVWLSPAWTVIVIGAPALTVSEAVPVAPRNVPVTVCEPAAVTVQAAAVRLVRAASAAVGGKGGGGRPDLAQAGGPDGTRAGAALDAVRDALASVPAGA